MTLIGITLNLIPHLYDTHLKRQYLKFYNKC